MQVTLTKKEVSDILTERFGVEAGRFCVFYTESNEEWEARNNQRISELIKAPDKKSFRIYF